MKSLHQREVFYVVLLLTLSMLSNIACKQAKTNPIESAKSQTEEAMSELASSEAINDLSFVGTINKNISVSLHYQKTANVIYGEITYLKSKANKPIRIIGQEEADHTFRILEFESNGNITGVMYGNIKDGTISGRWYSPTSNKDYELALKANANEQIPSKSIELKDEDLSGIYYYQYGKDGYLGSFQISRIEKNQYCFSINSVTGEPGRNMADVSKDTVTITDNKFTYEVPEATECKLDVQFYKNFLVVKYINSICEGDFGHNATVEGIYYKIK